MAPQKTDEMAGQDHHRLRLHLHDVAARPRMVCPVKILKVPVAAHREQRPLDVVLADLLLGLGEQRMAGAAIKAVRLPIERPVKNARRALRERADYKVEAAVGNALFELLRRPEAQLDEHAFGTRHEAAQRHLQAEVAVGDNAVNDAEPQPADQLALILADAGLESLDVLEQLARRGIGRAAQAGQPEAAPPALAKLAAKPPLQRAQMGAERRR